MLWCCDCVVLLCFIKKKNPPGLGQEHERPAAVVVCELYNITSIAT